MRELVFFCISTISERFRLMVFTESEHHSVYSLPIVKLGDDGLELSIGDMADNIEEESGYKIKSLLERNTGIKQRVIYLLDKDLNLQRLHYLVMFEKQEPTEENFKVFKSLEDVALKIDPAQKKDFAELIKFISNETFCEKYPEAVAIVNTYDLGQFV